MVDSHKVVSFVNYEVFLNAWYIDHSVLKTNFYRFNQNSA